MIKKIIACLTICFIITGILSPVFSDASALPQPNWSDPGISEIINISDLTGWMLNGGTFDVSTYTDAESFMNDYFSARTQTRLVSPGEAQEDYYEVLPGFGINNQLVAGESFARPLDTNRVISSSFRDHTGYGRRLSNEVNDALLSSGSLYDTKIPLLNEVEFANFIGYNHDALRLYSEFFNDDSEDPQPEIDPAYETYLRKINTVEPYGNLPINLPSYFTTGAGSRMDKNINDFSSISYFNYYNGIFNPFSFSNNGLNISNISGSSSLLDCYIVNDGNDNYSCTISNITKTVLYKKLSSPNDSYYFYKDVTASFNSETYAGTVTSWHNNYSNLSNYTYTYSGSLDQVLSRLSNYFRNINIYVDGQPWSIVGSPSSTPKITPEFPDAIGGEDLEFTTWPISRPRAPYYTNVPGVLQAIEDAIADDGKLDIDDLKPYLTDANGDPVPDPIFDPEPVPIPVPDPVNPDVVPGLPILPAIPPNMPSFNGVSVLAEIINFTNQSLPTALIVTFWGIVFGIVILGLIKILHK